MMYASEHDEGRYDPGPLPGELPGGEPKPTEGEPASGEPEKTEPGTEKDQEQASKSEPTAQDVEQWKQDLPTKPTPTSSPQDLYEIKQTGPTNFQVSGNGEKIWTDGIRSDRDFGRPWKREIRSVEPVALRR